MSEEVSKTESGLSEKVQKILSMLTPGERIILERLLELHPKEIGGTVYTVTGGYEGIELLDRKLERIMEQNMTGAEAEE